MTSQAAARSKTTPPRSEIPLEHKWNVESIFANDADWEQAIKEVRELLPQVTAFQGHLAEGPDKLVEAQPPARGDHPQGRTHLRVRQHVSRRGYR